MQLTVQGLRRRDFSRRRTFPGTEGSGFDGLDRLLAPLERIPGPLWASILLLIALVPTHGNFPLAALLCLFYLGDWGLLAALPRAGISFGPAQPTSLALAILRLPPTLFPLPWFLAAELIGTLLVLYAFWIEPQQLTLTRQSLLSPKLKPETRLRVLHLGDLHIERITGRERRLMALVRQAAPDLILFSGDFLNLSNLFDPVAWEDTRIVLRGLHAPLGCFAVSGSPAVDKPEVVARLLAGLDVRWLRDEKVTVSSSGGPIDLVGVNCTHKPFVDGPRMQRALGADPVRFTILLYHTPDLAPDAASAGIDLQLSGHTHGGQVRLPFFGALYTGSLYGKLFESGRRQLDQLTLYVTRGIGLEGKSAPRVRFLCPPEIVLWEIGGK